MYHLTSTLRPRCCTILNVETTYYIESLRLHMSDDNDTYLKKIPISTVRFGIGKEIRLYIDELAVTGQEEDQEIRIALEAIKRLILVPGDPNPAKLVLMADLDDDTTIILAEGMSNARDFRAMLPHLIELSPDLQLDPPDMGEQLRQALNNRRAWAWRWMPTSSLPSATSSYLTPYSVPKLPALWCRWSKINYPGGNYWW